MSRGNANLGGDDATSSEEFDPSRASNEPARPRPSEQLLIELVPELKAARLLCTSAGRGQLAAAAARADPSRSVVVAFFDVHLAERAASSIGEMPANLRVECVGDLPSSSPAGPFDAAMIPLRSGGDAEFAWELLQTAYVNLQEGGTLCTSSDEPEDHWVAGRMEALFGSKFTRRAARDGVVYSGIKRGPLKKVKEFAAEFAFRDRGRLIRATSRPGVFSHRKLDLGARALIESMAEPDASTQGALERDLLQPGQCVLDLGCGAGVVGFAAALRASDVRVHAIDSMPRAVDCARRGAEWNGLANYTTEVSATGPLLQEKEASASHSSANLFDLVLANPPYYSQHKIAEIFVAAATCCLKRGGRAHFVTKQADWFVEHCATFLRNLRVRVIRTYQVVDGIRR